MKKKFVAIIIIIVLLTTTTIAVSAQKTDSITGNSPPDTPDITAPEKVKRGKAFNVTVVTTDPDGDPVYYRHMSLNWTSSWYGPFPSGVSIGFRLKIRGAPGIYTIGFQAKDFYEAESGWAYVDINVPRSRAITSLFSSLLQSNFNLFYLLRQLIRFQ